MYFLFFKQAASSVFCDATDAICICMETSRVMYGNVSCYHSLYGFAVGTRMVLQALWEFTIPGTENILSMSKCSC